MTRQRGLTNIACAAAVGLALAWSASSGIRYVMEAPAVRDYTPGRPVHITDVPMPKPVADMEIQALRAKIDRDGVIRRFEAAHSWPVILAVRILAFLLDPLNLVMTVAFGGLALAVVRRLGRAASQDRRP